MVEHKGTSSVRLDEGVSALGGNIELSGFAEIDRDNMIVLKKIVSNYAKKFSETCKGFQKLSLKMKRVHESEEERSGEYELHAMIVDKGRTYVSEYVDHNLFIAVDKVFKKIETEITRNMGY